MPYATGETPQIGDELKCVRAGGASGVKAGLVKGKAYVASSGPNRFHSDCITVQGSEALVFSDRFELIRRATDVTKIDTSGVFDEAKPAGKSYWIDFTTGTPGGTVRFVKAPAAQLPADGTQVKPTAAPEAKDGADVKPTEAMRKAAAEISCDTEGLWCQDIEAIIARHVSPELAAARDEIEKLKAEIERLTKERDGWHRVVKDCERVVGIDGTADSPLLANVVNVVRDRVAEIAALKAEISRLASERNTAYGILDPDGKHEEAELVELARIVMQERDEYRHALSAEAELLKECRDELAKVRKILDPYSVHSDRHVSDLADKTFKCVNDFAAKLSAARAALNT